VHSDESQDHEGQILEHYLEQRQIVNSERYSDMRRNQLKSAIGSKRRGLSSSGVCPQHDNARRHAARHTVK
jgi:hypothetical protein